MDPELLRRAQKAAERSRSLWAQTAALAERTRYLYHQVRNTRHLVGIMRSVREIQAKKRAA